MGERKGVARQQAAAVLMTPLLQYLQEQGQDVAAILARYGLEEALFRDPEARVDVHVSTALLDYCQVLLEQPALGIELARHAQYTHFGALGLAVAAGGDLYSVLNRVTRFHRLISNLVRTELHVNDGTVELRFFSATEHEPHPQALVFVMASIVRVLRVRISADYNPLLVGYPDWLEDDMRVTLADYFNCPLAVGEGYALVFDKASANRILASSDIQLAAMLDATLSQRLAVAEEASLADRLSLWIQERLPDGEPAQKDAAEALCMSTRSLQRRLAEDGLTWKLLLENTRKSLVEQHLRTSGMSITQVAFLLGFSEVSAFSRAFKKWYGMPPSQFK
ncbi:AraC family transcriptional regulator [Alcanivorax sp. HI0083]|uniref:helix-turn-helix domain-containing protein n=1 Tax=unclassified Alcanivorax TaxID=2638842 RepID=UPI0007B8959D|nr:MULTISPECIES: AraC family transcriptional regulator [unclassified Alcanivorax]KZY30324.1 AraC family transcriptional regulator [Alcanivorax sp. HI0044]KZZ26494.1 AraC family transcriptional regulator [Alcanivorax sp. HI0083]